MNRAFIPCILAVLLAAGAASAETKVLVIADFETDAEKEKYSSPPQKEVVEENAKSGTRSLKFTNDGKNYYSFAVDEGRFLREFSKYAIVAVDIFNPQDYPVRFGARSDDAQSKDYGSRYNNDDLVAPPGWSTTKINLTGLYRTNTRNFSEMQSLDLSSLRLFSFFTFPHEKPNPDILYFDMIRLEDSGLPQVDGLSAFDFGPAKAPLFPGFASVTETTNYTPQIGYG